MNRSELTLDASTPSEVHAGSERYRVFIRHVFLILLVGGCFRIPVYLGVRPIWSGDSPGYAFFYPFLRQHIFFLGERTPVYPLFLGFAQWLVGLPPQPFLSLSAQYSAVILQSTCNVLAAIPFYALLRNLRIQPRTALAAALFFVTIPAICSYEMNILNMSLSVCLMVWTACLFVVTMNGLASGCGIVGWSLATGVVLSLAVLNRPDTLIFVVLLLAAMMAMWMRSRAHPRNSRPQGAILKSVLWMALPLGASLLGWMLLMYIGMGQFRITTLDGWNRSRTVYNMFDRVGPEDALIGEIMSRNYNQAVEKHANTNLREIVWMAQMELYDNAMRRRFPMKDTATDPSFMKSPIIQKGRKSLGLVTVPCNVQFEPYCWEFMRRKSDIGDYLGRVSWKLARNNPGKWLHNILANFAEESFNYHYGDAKAAVEGYQATTGNGEMTGRSAAIASFMGWAMNAEAPLLTFLYALTWAVVITGSVVFFRRLDEHWWHDAAVTALAIASIGTLVGTCVLAGLNRVYTLPHLVVFTICGAYTWEHRRRIVAAVYGVAETNTL